MTETNQLVPTILMMGLRHAGKSSIHRVVFNRTEEENTDSLIFVKIVDIPEEGMLFPECGAVVFVIDGQDDYYDALRRLLQTIQNCANVHYEVFIHKADGMSEETKMDTQREMHQYITTELLDIELDNVQLGFHTTTIYDHSIYEAFSKVVQKQVPHLPLFENMLNSLCCSSNIEKSFLFDSTTKIYIATDCKPVDTETYELCSDVIDVKMDMEAVYQHQGNKSARNGCVFQLTNGLILTLEQMGKLSLVCLIRAEYYQERGGLFVMNFLKFREAMTQILKVY